VKVTKHHITVHVKGGQEPPRRPQERLKEHKRCYGMEGATKKAQEGAQKAGRKRKTPLRGYYTGIMPISLKLEYFPSSLTII
jgi:hypothetical protein